MELGEALRYVLKYLWVVSCSGFQVQYKILQALFSLRLSPPMDRDEASLMAKEKEALKAGLGPCKLAELSTQGGTLHLYSGSSLRGRRFSDNFPSSYEWFLPPIFLLCFRN